MTDPPMVVGVVGAGSMADAHLRALARLGVAAVAYSPSGRAAALAAQTGAGFRQDLPGLIAAAQVVDICTPTGTHRELAEQAFAAGRDVICEKPLARTHGDARAMIDAAARAGRTLAVAHVVRYFAAYAAVRELVAAGTIGEVTELHLGRTGAAPGPGWFLDDKLSGGVLLDQLIHDFDFARWMLGEAVEVTATTETTTTPAGDPVRRAAAVLRHRGGAVTRVTGGWLEPGTEFTTEIRACGASGEIRHTSASGGLTIEAGGEVRHLDPGADLPYDTQLADLLAAARGEREPRVTAADALAALDLSLAAIESARTGRPVLVQALP